MRRNSIVPTLVLGLLTVLAGGAVALGLLLAPATPDLAVHNGAGETLLAPSVTAYYSSTAPQATVRIVYTAPDHLTESLLARGPGSRPVRSITIKGPRAVKALQPFQQLQTITGFTAKGARFVAVQQAATLVPANEAGQISGTVAYSAALDGGYLVDVLDRFRVTTPNGTQRGVDHYRVTSIGGQPVSLPRG